MSRDLSRWTDTVETLISDSAPGDLPGSLRAALAAVAAGITVSEGRRVTAEVLYRLADAVVCDA